MKLRVAWLADAETEDSYSARETRVVLRALSRRPDIIPLWFAVGCRQPPHLWNGIRVFPVPAESHATAEFLDTLLEQQRPGLLVSNISRAKIPAASGYLSRAKIIWLHRLNPEDEDPSGPGGQTSVTLAPSASAACDGQRVVQVPYIRELLSGTRVGADVSAVVDRLLSAIERAAAESRAPAADGQTWLVMRQQLFCNVSLSQVMFELTNALIKLGVPTIPQDEHMLLARGFVRREESMLRETCPEKFQRLSNCRDLTYDPERAITVHFTMTRPGSPYTRCGIFPSLAGREVLYTTGNHTVTPEGVRSIMEHFEMILAPSRHVLQPYLDAGVSSVRAAVVPHGIDTQIFSPWAEPLRYNTAKTFKFLQTSFPWVNEKGFDLTVKAFSRGFSSGDDAALVLRVPRVADPGERQRTVGRLEALIADARSRPQAPEMVLLEMDVPPADRGGVYTGADCCIHPLRAEGFGMTILEAMACGLPVIATPWSGPADFLSARYAFPLRHSAPIAERSREGRVLRWHVEPEVDHLVHLMRRAYEGREEARALGARAAQVARNQWTWGQAASKTAAALRLFCA